MSQAERPDAPLPEQASTSASGTASPARSLPAAGDALAEAGDALAQSLAATAESLARTAESVAVTVDKSAEMHEQMAGALGDAALEHAARDRKLAEAEREAAAAYRRQEVPSDELRRTIRDLASPS
jgi:hypothetical protein